MRPVTYSEPALQLHPNTRPLSPNSHQAGPRLVDRTATEVTLAPQRSWRQQYVRRIIVSDAGCAVLAALVGLLIRFGSTESVASPISILMAVALPALWVLAMLILRTYEKRFLLIPKSTLAHLEGVPKSGCVELNRRSPAVTLLDGYLGVLVSTLPTMSAPSRAAARDAALALVAGALREDASVDVTTAVPALRASMDAWIERHLDDPGLSPEALASAHAVSVRTLYRLYRDDGDTFGAVVRERRLERARQDLARGERSVSAIAARWGFADASHLSRSFKKAFGVTPRDYRASRVDTGA